MVRRLLVAIGALVVAFTVAGCGSAVGSTSAGAPGSAPAAALALTGAATPKSPTVDTNPAVGFPLQVKPVTLELSGDASNVVSGLIWSVWDGAGAMGNGTVNVLSCIPNCAEGTSTPTPVQIDLYDPIGGVFSLLTETIQGRPALDVSIGTVRRAVAIDTDASQ